MVTNKKRIQMMLKHLKDRCSALAITVRVSLEQATPGCAAVVCGWFSAEDSETRQSPEERLPLP